MAGRTVRNDPTAGRKILAGLALGAAAGTLVVWGLWLMTGRGAIPLYAHQRHLGLHMLVGAIATSFLIVRPAVTRNGRVLWYAVGTVVWGGLLWSGGRTPLLAVLVGLGTWFIFRPKDRKGLLLATVCQLVAGLVLSSVFWTPRPELGWWHAIGRTSAAVSTGSTTQLTSARSDFWRETAERARTAPWLGHGPDSYRFLTPKLDGQQPHNVALQLWLDLGLLGAVPVLSILVITLYRGWSRTATSKDEYVPWLALLTASAAGGMLDGVFYHVLAFFPAMLAVGVSLEIRSSAGSPPKSVSLPVTVVATLAAGIISFHSWIFYKLALGEPPPPTSFAARCVRAFPSSTFGLWRWLDAWQQEYPDAVLDTVKWAQTHSPSAPLFHIYAARVLLARGERDAANIELAAARTKAHRTARPAVDAVIESLHSAPR
jgi:hypothetical protein